MLSGFITRKIGFFRTPKMARTNRLLSALYESCEEMLFVIALLLGAMAVHLRPDGHMIDAQLWFWVLLVQCVPYSAAVLMSIVSALPHLPARLVGQVPRMGQQPLGVVADRKKTSPGYLS